MSQLLTLILVGLSVGLGNFAASVAIGLGGISREVRLRVAIVFGVFETGMPIVGLIIGEQVSGYLGGKANLIGGTLLGLTGIYLVVSALRSTDDKDVKQATKGTGKLLLAGLALSIDNLVVGFSLGTYHVSLWLAAVVIGVTSVVLSLIGLKLGHRLGKKVEEYSEILSGVILLCVGIAVGFKLL